jgi:hypothetical protein
MAFQDIVTVFGGDEVPPIVVLDRGLGMAAGYGDASISSKMTPLPDEATSGQCEKGI